MMNQTQLAAWTENLLVSHSVDFTDEEGDVNSYPVGGDHAELAADVFSVDDCTLTVYKDGNVLGGIGFANEYCDKEQGAVTDAYNFHMGVEHLVKEFSKV